MRAHRILVPAYFAFGLLRAQTTTLLKFEVASVKQTSVPSSAIGGFGNVLPGSGLDPSHYKNTGGPGTADPSRIHYPLISLVALIHEAYKGFYEIKTPEWAVTDRMEIDATMPATTTKEQFQSMLQNLLIDRFGIKTHVETKEVRGYALRLGKDGPKIKEAQPDAETVGPSSKETDTDGWPVPPPHLQRIIVQSNRADASQTRVVAPHATMAKFAAFLALLTDAPVEDSTGLKGEYAFTLRFGVSDDSTPSSLPDIFGALQSQLGLKLESRKAPVDVLVVDHLEKAPLSN